MENRDEVLNWLWNTDDQNIIIATFTDRRDAEVFMGGGWTWGK